MKREIIIILIIWTIFLLFVSTQVKAAELLPHQKQFIDKYSTHVLKIPELTFAICGVESNFGRYTNSQNPEYGVMQMKIIAGRHLVNMLKIENISDDKLYEEINKPKVALLMADRFIRCLIDEFNGDVNKAILAYNRGTSNVRKTPHLDPNNYVYKVNKLKIEVSKYLKLTNDK